MSPRWPVLAASAVLLVAIGAGGTYISLRSGARSPAAADGRPATGVARGQQPAETVSPAISPDRPLPDVVVTLTEEAVRRAQITAIPVVAGAGSGEVRLPAVVEPNTYRQVVVTPLVTGRVTRVLVELGAHVRQGQTMAEVFSPELTDAQTRYISARAELEAHEQELDRSGQLVRIGAASRQELERLHAEHASRKTSVESARSRLELLGLPLSTIESLTAGKPVEANTNVRAPIAGVVTERLANVGLNVDPAAKLFTVVDLSNVWVVGDLYEKDFSRVRVGSSVTVTASAYPDLRVQGRISYIDPQVSPDTRTARVRVEVPNPRQELRLGMYAEVRVETSDRAPVTLIPRRAIQHVGDRSVVYLVNPSRPGQFTEREVRLGQQTGEQAEVVSGVGPGDLVVADGSFFVRAERERLGLRQAEPAPAGPGSSGQLTPQPGGQTAVTVQTAKVVVGAQGFEPATLRLRAGVHARLTFLRTTDKTCATEVVFPSLEIERPLPLNVPVEIELTPVKAGEIAFACGMKMFTGSVVVE